nr:PREDICTED: collagen alpha-1(IX) chain-like [Lepisosteus oculatus]
MGELIREKLVFIFLLGCLIQKCFATVQHSQRFPLSAGAIQSQLRTCPQIKVGEDDLPGFDVISQFHLGTATTGGTIQRVVGSTPSQVAYIVGPEYSFRLQTRAAYPFGLPEEFSFLATFRMSGSTLHKNWNIWQIQDAFGNEQLAVRMNGKTRSVEFSCARADHSLQTAVFSFIPSLFDSQWHKILLSVETGSVTLFVDCDLIDSQKISPRGGVNLDGFSSIGKLKDNAAVAVPKKTEKETQIIQIESKASMSQKASRLPEVWGEGVAVAALNKHQLQPPGLAETFPPVTASRLCVYTDAKEYFSLHKHEQWSTSGLLSMTSPALGRPNIYTSVQSGRTEV